MKIYIYIRVMHSSRVNGAANGHQELHHWIDHRSKKFKSFWSTLPETKIVPENWLVGRLLSSWGPAYL